MVMQKKERVTVDEEEGKIIPFWNAAPPEDSLRSWERRRKKKRKQERGEWRGSRGQDMGLDWEKARSVTLITQSAPLFQTWG